MDVAQLSYAPTMNGPIAPPVAATAPGGSDGSVLLLVGIVLQAIFTLVWVDAFRSSGLGAVAAVATIGGLMLLLAIFGAFLPVQKKQYGSAATVALLLGILGLLPGLIVTGVVYIIAYTQIARARDAAERPLVQYRPVELVYVQAPPPPPVMRKCSYCGSDYNAVLTACPTCGAPA